MNPPRFFSTSPRAAPLGAAALITASLTLAACGG